MFMFDKLPVFLGDFPATFLTEPNATQPCVGMDTNATALRRPLPTRVCKSLRVLSSTLEENLGMGTMMTGVKLGKREQVPCMRELRCVHASGLYFPRFSSSALILSHSLYHEVYFGVLRIICYPIN